MVIAWLLLSCGATSAPTVAPPTLDAVALLTRASLDLRGVRPDVADLDAVIADPAAVDGFIEGYLADPQFGRRVAMIYAEALQVRADQADHADQRYTFDDADQVLTSLGEEPLRLIATIADQDLPWTTVTTADWTMADGWLARWYPIDWPSDVDLDDDWLAVPWTDGRPDAGILSTNGFYWRYSSTDLNANRGRFNAISRALLCHDYLLQPVSASPSLDLTDEDAVRQAIRTEPACVACHNFLDPASAFMWGFTRQDPFSILDLSSYHPQDEWLWETDGIPPAYGGVAGEDLEDLGWLMADDPRLLSCAVERAVTALWGRSPELSDTARLDALRTVFIEGGLALRPLYAAVVAADEYRADPGVDGAVGWRVVTPDLLVSEIAGLTGYRPRTDGLDLWASDKSGLRSLAGAGRSVSADSPSVAAPAAQVVQARLAEAAAGYVTGSGRDDPEAMALFSLVDLDDPDPAALDAQVQALWLQVLSQPLPVDADDVQATVALWWQLRDDGAEPADAWAGVLTALLRHPDLVVY